MNQSQLDKFMDEMPLRGVPESRLLVSIGGETVYDRGVGIEDPSKDLTYICSVSKVTTCVAAMQLIEQGKINLCDPVEKYLPAFSDLTVGRPDGTAEKAQNKMTVIQLFTMTGGLNYALNTEPMKKVIAENPHAGTVELVNAMAKSPLSFEPGQRFQYSLCHDVLAAVVEVVSGLRFADYLKKFIFDPLGMKDSGFHVPEEFMPRMKKQYRFYNSRLESLDEPLHNVYILTDNYDSGGAGIYTTAYDQLKLFTALANGGISPDGQRILSEQSVKEFEVPRLTAEQRRSFFDQRLHGYSWGLCGRVHVNPYYSLSHSPVGEFGWDGATGPFGLVDRKNKLAIYFETHIYGNSYLYNRLHYAIRDMVYETFLE